jgi:hypothetical protein
MALDDELPGLIDVVDFRGPMSDPESRKSLARLEAKIAEREAYLRALREKPRVTSNGIETAERSLADLKRRRMLFGEGIENRPHDQQGEETLKGTP